jgi:hypothetical protein
MSIDQRSTEDLPAELMINAITIGLNLRKHISPIQAVDIFEYWWQVITALNRGGGDLSFDDLNMARRNLSMLCFSLAYHNEMYKSLKVMTEPLNYNVVEEINQESEIPEFDTEAIEGESDADRLNRLESQYDQYRNELYEKNQEEEENEGEESLNGNLYSEFAIFNDQLKDLVSEIFKIHDQKPKPKHSSKVYLWFMKISSEILSEDFSGYSRFLASQVYMKYEEIVSSKTWNVEATHKKIVSRIKTLEYRDIREANEEWEKDMTKLIRAYKGD